ncbi:MULTISPECIES: 50S ribosomal protein L25/general stress protein Ctc [unclassified Streptomyces]|uniref:50S ribosomal protein L25/general stress protein Ctc n=1 Tax=unclassified Streptomyces TaxID=2593676 RepID=UPI002DD97174|nr:MULTISPECIES: 50S ribosomal protein L25/general stress protein Ctc [unclassified Streptomyces]WSA94255.1 50S ribosomal protein L25/general stress protein Ctc [Streptomyces sp. NBC_01795]WSB78673.1 50S ribosomal protein L25/general stress protein Ctc [Streptomyces sp. NBC_01775]WSS13123.1 50S ribosomal protein L25/general stress protein Ctc [Streptomyces sp. NBC_01186]WSS41906.1 50S ribosomal protein L25/general stress protein Ctc [Streptomyces sp. NBC_01187]
MADVNVSATVRREFGKGAARRLRREEKVPAVIYGHGAETVHVALPSYDMMMALKNSNVLIHLDVEGKKELVIPKAVQREAIRGFLVHIDLLTVKRGEKVQVEVPIHIEGELAPGQHLLEHVYNSLPVEAEATHIPESVTVSIDGLSAGDSVAAKDIQLPRGTSLAIEEDETVIQVLSAQAEEPAAEGAEGEGAEAPAAE